MTHNRISTHIRPDSSMQILSRNETSQLRDDSLTGFNDIFRRCSLAVLNCGNENDNTAEILEEYQDFEIEVIQESRGIRLDITNAPEQAFVDGEIIKGIKEHLFTVLRDVVFIESEVTHNAQFDLTTSSGTTNAVFHILRNAQMLVPNQLPNLAVCWGGHSIGREEYEYTKSVGYELGLRGINIATGCGPGAMKGPMKGATIGHAKQRLKNGRYLGISEPGIIAAESPNPIVNELVIMPDIEKRLEAFVRTAHGIIVYPGGVGTAEEILYLLGILLHPDNEGIPFPLIFTAPVEAKDYFKQMDEFIGNTLGHQAQNLYQIIINDPKRVATLMAEKMKAVEAYRRSAKDAYYFNWSLTITHDYQVPFEPTHENMAKLELHTNQEPHILAANLRRVFSGIVSGNVKEAGIRAIEKHGSFEISGDKELMQPLDALLQSFIAQKRMKLNVKDYQPCYKIVN